MLLASIKRRLILGCSCILQLPKTTAPQLVSKLKSGKEKKPKTVELMDPCLLGYCYVSSFCLLLKHML